VDTVVKDYAITLKRQRVTQVDIIKQNVLKDVRDQEIVGIIAIINAINAR